jgi:Zn-dependent metalloprotease
LERLLSNKDPAVRAAAHETLLQTARLRGQRSILSHTFFAAAEPGLHRSIYDAGGMTVESGKLVRDEGRPATQDTAVNDVYKGFGDTYKLYSEVFHRDSIDDKGLRLIGVVHYGSRYNNAFWNGSRMLFGDGDGKAFIGFTKAVDVIGHELTHGVTEFTCGLEYHSQPGALNESMSDVFGSLVKQYALKQAADNADWLIGAGILGPALKGKALRSMKAPGTAFDGDDQPAHMSGYVKLPDTEAGDNGGVHTNSGIPNHAFYLLATELGGNAWEDAGQIWYDTLQSLKPTSDFKACAGASYQVASQRFGSGSKQQQAVANAWDGVGLKIGKPAIAVSLADSGNGHALRARLEGMAAELQHAAEMMEASS